MVESVPACRMIERVHRPVAGRLDHVLAASAWSRDLERVMCVHCCANSLYVMREDIVAWSVCSVLVRMRGVRLLSCQRGHVIWSACLTLCLT